MKFRTEIEIENCQGLIRHDQSIVMLGSCFTDNIGEQLDRDGFHVTHNPFGALYNPASIRSLITRALQGRSITADELVCSSDGAWHCLDFASRYSDASAERLIERTNAEMASFADALRSAATLIITLGTAYVFARRDTGVVVGNCHKLPAARFDRYRLSAKAITGHLMAIASVLPPSIQRIIVTVSPIRHTADGLHGNQLSKASLLLSVDEAVSALPQWSYFPAFEIMVDDLRDYRFYAADMKHPSDVGIEYIYDRFRRAYFDDATVAKAAECRKAWLRSQHRPLMQY